MQDNARSINNVRTVIAGFRRASDHLTISPSGLNATVSGYTVALQWQGPAIQPSSYQIEAGSAAGMSDLAAVDTGSTAPSYIASNVPQGQYFIRVRANASGVPGPASNEVIVSVPSACQLPAAPANPIATVSGASVSLNWPNVPGAGGYLVEVGLASGQTTVGSFEMAAPGRSAQSVPPGTYFVRVRARKACGSNVGGVLGPASSEIIVSVPPACQPPAAPATPVATVSGASVSLNWPSVPGAGGYLVEVGLASGQTIVGSFETATPALSAQSVFPGTYFVRVRARNACGSSLASTEAVVTVAQPAVGKEPSHRTSPVALQ